MFKYLTRFLIALLVILTTLLVGIFVEVIMDRIKEKEITTIECKLLNRNTQVSSGKRHDITTFNCGDYGVLISENKEIFRRAKENNKLNVYFGEHYYRISSIKE
jgi:hypothetical protein